MSDSGSLQFARKRRVCLRWQGRGVRSTGFALGTGAGPDDYDSYGELKRQCSFLLAMLLPLSRRTTMWRLHCWPPPPAPVSSGGVNDQHTRPSPSLYAHRVLSASWTPNLDVQSAGCLDIPPPPLACARTPAHELYPPCSLHHLGHLYAF